ncbi:hypothetical protein [Halalkalibacter wakoensis]|nr:hypothetical protein [Halalkalibacter wakoensis]
MFWGAALFWGVGDFLFLRGVWELYALLSELYAGLSHFFALI